MAQALRVARLPVRLAAPCVNAVAPSALGAARRWQLSPTRRPLLVDQLRLSRYIHTTVSPGFERMAKADNSALAPNRPLQISMTEAGIVDWAPELLTVRYPDGRAISSDPIWLRDMCECPRCVDPDSGQKTFSVTDLPSQIEIEHAELVAADGSLLVRFANDSLSASGTHTSVFPAAELKLWQANSAYLRGGYELGPTYIPWDRPMYEALVAEGRGRINYNDWIQDGDAFWDAFADLCRMGLILVTDVPEAEHEVVRIANRVGPLMPTFYGLTWDVKSKPRAENVAYTSQYLGLHQDLLYHEPVPKLQLLHCLANSCKGGESFFSNGLRAAFEMWLTKPDLYTLLAKKKIWFRYHKGGHHYYRGRYTCLKHSDGRPKDTNWAPPFQAAFRRSEGGPWLRSWKKAAEAFRATIESPDNVVEFKLKPGECVIFDNCRVLHGRREFAAGQGSRWLKGAYISPQSYQAKVTQLAKHLRSRGEAEDGQNPGKKQEAMVAESLRLRGAAILRQREGRQNSSGTRL